MKNFCGREWAVIKLGGCYKIGGLLVAIKRWGIAISLTNYRVLL